MNPLTFRFRNYVHLNRDKGRRSKKERASIRKSLAEGVHETSIQRPRRSRLIGLVKSWLIGDEGV